MSLKYRISNIGWYNFELLVQSLLKALIGPGVTAFGGSKDKGRDATFAGPAAFPSPQSQWNGNWVFQVKYIDFEEQGADAARSSLKSALRTEIQRKQERHRDVDNYVLLTDVPLTGHARDEINRIVSESGFVGNFAAIDGKDICQFLDNQAEIRKSFPQLLGLADLDVIVNRDLYARSQAYLESWQPRLATYVQTSAHARAMTLLKKTYFIVLDGPPEAGKSTIAAAIALVHATDGFEIIDVRNSNDVFRASDTRDARGRKKKKKRLFIADDAIGSNSLVAARVEDWSRDLPGIIRQLNRNRLLVWTARRYILEEALATSRLREAEAEFPRPHEVVVKVGELTHMQKAEILYNHAKQANLSLEHRKLVREYAHLIISHQNFSPLRIRELTTIILKNKRDGTRDKKAVTWEVVWKFLNDPGETWIQAYRALSQSEQILLSAMLDFDGPCKTKDLRANYELRVSRLEQGHLSFADCISRLDHSFLAVSTSHNREQNISFQHPTLRDMLLLHLREDPHARRRYISMASAFGLAGMISGIAKKAKSEDEPEHTVLPRNADEFALFQNRLHSVSQSVLTVRDWALLLSASENLIPEKAETANKYGDDLASVLIQRNEKVEPVDLDLASFSSTNEGRIIRAVLNGFSSKNTYDYAQRFSEENWEELLGRFYYLTGFLSPPVYPGFTTSLCTNLPTSTDSIRLANLINGAEPLVVRQSISRAVREEWRKRIEQQAMDLAHEGENFGGFDDASDFDDWYDAAENLLKAAKDFRHWGTTESLSNIEKLSKVFDASERPHEPDSEIYDDWAPKDSGPYWSVDRLFEDL